MRKSYQELKGHPADFRVKYRFYSEQEGGRKSLPWQGYRSDFYYEHNDHENQHSIFMIWPEFEKTAGVPLTHEVEVDTEGTAAMWIVDPQRRVYHRDKISVGLRGWFMEGPRRVAECEVIEVLGLLTNPA
jgi:hypothetical protein